MPTHNERAGRGLGEPLGSVVILFGSGSKEKADSPESEPANSSFGTHPTKECVATVVILEKIGQLSISGVDPSRWD